LHESLRPHGILI